MMDALTYLKEKARMTGTKALGCSIKCDTCPLSIDNNGTSTPCKSFEALYPEEAIKIVEKWSKEHPQKTRMEYLLERFPQAMMTQAGFPMTCAQFLGIVDQCPGDEECKKCWNAPMEE